MGGFGSGAEGESLEDALAALQQTVSSCTTIFPLPPVPQPPQTSSRCHKARQRWRKSKVLWERTNLTIWTLNKLWSTNFEDLATFLARSPESRVVEGMACADPQLVSTWKQMLQYSARVIAGRRAVESTGAELIGALHRIAEESYAGLAAVGKYVAFDSSRIVEPPIGDSAIKLLDVLPMELRDLYSTSNAMIPSQEDALAEIGAWNSQFDKVLGPYPEYVKYLNRTDVQSLWLLKDATLAQGTLTLAAVAKKDSEDLRKILMTCPMNTIAMDVPTVLGHPPEYGLNGPGALAQLRVVKRRYYLGTYDESNAFTYLETPSWWWPWLAGLAVYAGPLPYSWAGHFPPETLLRPWYRRLPMGHTHSVFLLMAVNFGSFYRVQS